MTNKEKAISFLQLAGTGSVNEAYDSFVSDHFLHHNPYFKGDRESLKIAMEEAHKTSPNISVDIKKVFEDNESIITHSHIIKKDMEIAVVHIFKFENGKIVELWDLAQILDKNSTNENGVF